MKTMMFFMLLKRRWWIFFGTLVRLVVRFSLSCSLFFVCQSTTEQVGSKKKPVRKKRAFPSDTCCSVPVHPPLSTVSPRRDATHVGMPPTRWLGMLLLGMMSKNFVGRCDFGHHTKSTYKVLCHFTFQAGVCAASLICCDFGVMPRQRYRRCFLHPVSFCFDFQHFDVSSRIFGSTNEKLTNMNSMKPLRRATAPSG